MERVQHARQVARFDGFELDLRAGELRPSNNGGSAVNLPEQPFRILAMLVERPGEVLTRQEIRSALWPNGTVVEFEHSISVAINRLRQTLGDSAEAPRYIETLARRGYRWKPSVEWIEESRSNGSSAQAPLATLPETESKSQFSNWLYGAGAVAAILAAFAIFWSSRPKIGTKTLPVALNMRQLTINSFENRVLSGSISPDGKLLAMSDANGVRIELLATGEMREVPQPDEVQSKHLQWEIVGTWLPDGSGFFANAHAPRSSMASVEPGWSSSGSSIWSFSALGAAPHKLRDDALAYSVSPDGSTIAFGANPGKLGDREIWFMSSHGERARKLVAAEGEDSLTAVQWSKDGKRILYKRTSPAGTALLSRSPEGHSASELLGPSDTKGMVDFFPRSDGQLLYSKAAPGTFDAASCNLWDLQLDERTGEPLRKPRQLTNWSGFCLSGLSATADGTKIAFLKSVGNLTSFVAELTDDGKQTGKFRHFPLSESWEAVTDWLSDGESVIFVSNRSGEFKVYKQPLDQDVAEPLVTSGYGRNPRVMPGDSQLVYLGIGEKGPWPARGPEPVMTVSLGGGPARKLFTARPYSLITCARVPSGICVIGEPSEGGNQLIVTAIDPQNGRADELFRFPIVAGDDSWYLDISPKSDRIAVTSTSAGPIHVLSLRGEHLLQVEPKPSKKILAVLWDAAGNGFYITAGVQNGMEVLHINQRGDASSLWENLGATGETLAIPSPDGRRLALNGWTTSSNIWILEDVPH